MTKAVAKGYEGVASGLEHGTAACLSGVVQIYREIQRPFVKRQCCFFFHFICTKPFRGFLSIFEATSEIKKNEKEVGTQQSEVSGNNWDF